MEGIEPSPAVFIGGPLHGRWFVMQLPEFKYPDAASEKLFAYRRTTQWVTAQYQPLVSVVAYVLERTEAYGQES